MRKTAAALIMALLITATAGASFVRLGKANPWMGWDWVSPRGGTQPPVLTIESPQEGALYRSRYLTLSLNANVGQAISASGTRLMQVYYRVDWQENETYLYKNENVYVPYDPNEITACSITTSLNEIPDGRHSITVYAVEWGAYIEGLYFHMFSINSSSTINFTTYTISPSVSVLSIVNKTYETSNIPLSFTINKPVSEITYSLDERANVTIDGNMTLTGLADGNHTLTVYAKDKAGFMGKSETISFTVAVPEPEPVSEAFPPTSVAVAVTVGAIPAVAAGLLRFTRRKRRKEAALT